jgi:starvation-inducible DNA-binding protein
MTKVNAIGLDEQKSLAIAKSLNGLLADLHIFYQNLRGFHWNIKGSRFFSLHSKFEELYDEVSEDIDEVAERILTIGGSPVHTLSEYLHMTKLKETANVSNGDEALKITAENYAHLINLERAILNQADEAGDEGTNAMMSDLITKQEKTMWMLRSVLG